MIECLHHPGRRGRCRAGAHVLRVGIPQPEAQAASIKETLYELRRRRKGAEREHYLEGLMDAEVMLK